MSIITSIKKRILRNGKITSRLSEAQIESLIKDLTKEELFSYMFISEPVLKYQIKKNNVLSLAGPGTITEEQTRVLFSNGFTFDSLMNKKELAKFQKPELAVVLDYSIRKDASIIDKKFQYDHDLTASYQYSEELVKILLQSKYKYKYGYTPLSIYNNKRVIIDYYFETKDESALENIIDDEASVNELFDRGYRISENTSPLITRRAHWLIQDFIRTKDARFINSSNRYDLYFSPEEINQLFENGYVLTSESPRELRNSDNAIILNFIHNHNPGPISYLKNELSASQLESLFEAGYKIGAKSPRVIQKNEDAIVLDYKYNHDPSVFNYLDYTLSEAKIEKVLEYGYELTNSSPSQLFRFKVLADLFKKNHNQELLDYYFIEILRGKINDDQIIDLIKAGYTFNDKNIKLFIHDFSILVEEFCHSHNPKYINMYQPYEVNFFEAYSSAYYREKKERAVKKNHEVEDIKILERLFANGYCLSNKSPKELANNSSACVYNYIYTHDEECLYRKRSEFSKTKEEIYIRSEEIRLLFENGFRLRVGGPFSTRTDAVLENFRLYQDNEIVKVFLKAISNNYDKSNNRWIEARAIEEVVKKLINLGYIFQEDDPDIVFENAENVILMYNKTKNPMPINKYPYDFEENKILEIIDSGYQITKDSNKDILRRSIAFKRAIEKGQNPNIICYFEGWKLSDETIKTMFDHGFDVANAPQEFSKVFPLITDYCIKNNRSDQISSYVKNNFTRETLKFIISGKLGDLDNLDLDSQQMKIIKLYVQLREPKTKNFFLDIVFQDDYRKCDIDKLKIICRIENSNSSELRNVSSEVVEELLKKDNPLDYLNRIEEIFVKNNLPYAEKVYKVFQLMHPNVSIDHNSEILRMAEDAETRNQIVHNDVIKCAILSNNRNLRDYLQKLIKGNQIFDCLADQLRNKTEEEKLDYVNEYLYRMYDRFEDEYLEFSEYIRVINTITNEITAENNNIESISQTIVMLINHYQDKDIEKQLINKYFSKVFPANMKIESLSDILKQMEQARKNADQRNRQRARRNDFSLETGDLVKGLCGDGIYYLNDILQNGSLCKEMLASCATSDCTPLDTDVSFVRFGSKNPYQAIQSTCSVDYGPIWLVMKNDDRFIQTRSPSFGKQKYYNNAELKESRFQKYELFVNFNDAGGIRTGFPSTEIDMIIVERYSPEIGLEIVKNGFYIPVKDRYGKLVFTEEEYDNLREKMDGLSHYNVGKKYHFSENLDINISDDNTELKHMTDDIEIDFYQTVSEEHTIKKMLQEILEPFNLKLKDRVDGDLTPGFVEIINTGSTGRHTNLNKGYDYDFILRFDHEIMLNRKLFGEIRDAIYKGLKGTGSMVNGDIKEYHTEIISNNKKKSVDVDFSFVSRTDKISYSTDECLKDRLRTIQRQDPEKYRQVLSNIIFAKKFFKYHNAYKPSRKDESQGGMGAVGIENWILQNGGSFVDAAREFLRYADSCRSFQEFRDHYYVFDFGFNHLAQRKGVYPHDNFINNMNENGYNRIKEALRRFLRSLKQNTYQELVSIKR